MLQSTKSVNEHPICTSTWNRHLWVYRFNSPITDLANDLFLRVAKPRSPILTLPVVPVMKILSHFRSRCIIGGVLECRKLRPFRICRHHDFRTLGLIFLNLLRYLYSKCIKFTFPSNVHRANGKLQQETYHTVWTLQNHVILFEQKHPPQLWSDQLNTEN